MATICESTYNSNAAAATITLAKWSKSIAKLEANKKVEKKNYLTELKAIRSSGRRWRVVRWRTTLAYDGQLVEDG